MQIDAMNSINFKNGYYSDLSKTDIEEAEKLSEILRNYNDSFKPSYYDNENEAPKKKGILNTIASVAIGSLVLFAIAKKGYKNAAALKAKVLENPTVQKIRTSADNLIKSDIIKNAVPVKFLGNLKEQITKIPGVKAVQQGTKTLVEKVKPENLFAGAASLGATTYVATTDGNNNGIPDIAEKGVNAYKNAIKQLDVIKEVVDLVA